MRPCIRCQRRRSPGRRARPFVIGSGLAGRVQPSGGRPRWRLVPRPILPGRCRSRPVVSAAPASFALAPPRKRLIRSRRRRASSKSSAAAAAAIRVRKRATWSRSILSSCATLKSLAGTLEKALPERKARRQGRCSGAGQGDRPTSTTIRASASDGLRQGERARNQSPSQDTKNRHFYWRVRCGPEQYRSSLECSGRAFLS